MKYLIVSLLVVVFTSCRHESDCDKKLNRVIELDRQLTALKSKRGPEFNDGKDMAIARIAIQKSIAQREYNACVNGE